MKFNANLLIGFSEVVRRFYIYYAEQIEALEIKEVHAKMVHLISDHNGLTQQEIADLAMLPRSTTSEIMTEMVKANLVERRGDQRDRRLSRIYLTERGVHVTSQIRHYFDEYCQRCYKNFSDEEMKQFEALILKFNYQPNDR